MTSIPGKTRNTAAAPSDWAANLRRSLKDRLLAIQFRLGAAARAHDRRRASEALGPETMRDTGMPPEDASGIQAWQADLPFFMQSGFGRR